MLNPQLAQKTLLRTLAHALLHLRNRHFALIDFLIFILTPALALYLRTDSLLGSPNLGQPLFWYTVLALVVRMATFQYYGMYQRYWRFVSAHDFAQLVMAASLALLATAIGAAILWNVDPVLRLPRSLPFIDAMLALLIVGGIRASVRLTESIRSNNSGQPAAPPKKCQRTLIVGAGYTGALLAREIRDNQQIHLPLIGFIDDDPNKRNVQIYNVPVLGTREQLPAILEARTIERVIIAMPSASGEVIRDVVNICQRANVPVQTMPGVHELINDQVSISKLRNVQIEDLLRRTPIQTDTRAVRNLLCGKRVLITGAGGSIGSELCRQILRCQPNQLILVGHGENSVFEIQQELLRWQANERELGVESPTLLIPVIADLRFQPRVKGIFAKHRPHIVFHAAAHKHVPLMEENPVEAITNNVLGTRLLLAAAQAHEVERFVMISTDKAVNPTNVMGASKRVAELLVLQAARRSGRFYQVVRFGNVLGSRGSVIHTFKRQIAAGGPVSVTHPEMVRYFMTIPEAVQLVLQASVVGKGAEILMLDMGDPVRISQLAQDLIELSGLQVGRDIKIAYSGLRPGEKLFEEMFKPDEDYMRTEHEKIFIAPNASQIVPAALDSAVDGLVESALDDHTAEIFHQLTEILPEYQRWSSTTENTANVRSFVQEAPTSPSGRLTLTPAAGD
ncbi:MAG: polysaccharide biosynthesis protein [Caldilineaceae bacterium]|nr:polysaccharide biosynthesis protein [Caldilineaceae bacterium]